MTKYISIFNNKGGVGKSTIAWNAGHALAEKGHRVVLIDFDAQCNLSIGMLGIEAFTQYLPTQNAPYGTTIRAYLQRFLQNTGGEQLFHYSAPNSSKNLSIVAGDFWLNVFAESLSVGADLLTGNGLTKYACLRHMIQSGMADTPPDYVLIDLPPSFGALVRSALYCSDYYLVPCTSDTFSPYCISLIGQMIPMFIDDWKQGLNRFKASNPGFTQYDNIGSPKFAGWIFNGFDMRAGKYVQADDTHRGLIVESIDQHIIQSPNVPKTPATPSDWMSVGIQDMNVLVQNSLWLSVPVGDLSSHKPVKNMRDRGTWSRDQLENIDDLRGDFMKLADHIVNHCP